MTGTEGVPPAPWGASTEGGATGKKKRKTGRNVAIVGGVALLLVVVGAAASPLGAGAAVELAASGDMSKPLNAESAKDLAFTITGGKISDVTLKLDGNVVQAAQEGDKFVFRPSGLSDGKHTFSASKDGRLPGRTSTASKSFELDTTAPVVTFELPTEPVKTDEAFTLKGKVEGAKTADLDGEALTLGKDGTFSKEFAAAPRAATLKATDEAGNITEQSAAIPVLNDSGARSVHLTAFGWASAQLREPILQLLKDKKIDNIQLDIKDEDGIIGYQSEVPLAKAAGTGSDRYVAADALKTIHDLGGTVTGRIVAFRDPKLAKYAVNNGKMDLVIQNTSGGAYSAGNYGVASFTNFANQEVIDYNVGLAEESAKLGFDQIMFDYIRKPENTGQVYPGIGDRTASEAIVDFVETAGERTKAAGASVGAAVYGISAFTPVSVAQDIPEFAKHLDFISPMVYPSHWGPGEYSVAKPNSQPYDIVNRSMMEFNRLVLGTDCAIVPWLQDFSLGVRYGAAEVKAQIKAAADAGINGFYLWNASSKYTGSALETMQAGDSQPGELVYSMVKPGVNPGEGSKDKAKAEEYIKAYLEAKKNGTDFVAPGTASTTPAAGTETATSSTEGEGSSDPNSTSSTTAPATASTPAATPKPSETSTP